MKILHTTVASVGQVVSIQRLPTFFHKLFPTTSFQHFDPKLLRECYRNAKASSKLQLQIWKQALFEKENHSVTRFTSTSIFHHRNYYILQVSLLTWFTWRKILEKTKCKKKIVEKQKPWKKEKRGFSTVVFARSQMSSTFERDSEKGVNSFFSWSDLHL